MRNKKLTCPNCGMAENLVLTTINGERFIDCHPCGVRAVPEDAIEIMRKAIKKSKWQEEFEDEICEQVLMQGVDFKDNEIIELLDKYIGGDKEKVKIKCKDGMILIERLK